MFETYGVRWWLLRHGFPPSHVALLALLCMAIDPMDAQTDLSAPKKQEEF